MTAEGRGEGREARALALAGEERGGLRGDGARSPAGAGCAHESQGEFGHMGLKGSQPGLQQAELVAQVCIRDRRLKRGAVGTGESEGGLSRGSWLAFFPRQGAAMQVSQVMELGWCQAFQTSIGGMRCAGEMGRFEPET